MKKCLLILAAVLIAASTVTGQETKSKKDGNPCKHGLLFDVEGLNHLGLGPYGCGIGKKFTRGDYAFRPTLSFLTRNTQDDPGVAGYTGQKDTEFKIGVDLDFLRQTNSTMKFQPYYGLGFGWESMKVNTEAGHAVHVDPFKTDSTRSTFMIRGIVGGEYFLGKHFSLSGEYRIGYYHSVEKIKLTGLPLLLKSESGEAASPPESKTTVSGFRIFTDPRLTLGVYF